MSGLAPGTGDQRLVVLARLGVLSPHSCLGLLVGEAHSVVQPKVSCLLRCPPGSSAIDPQ